MNTIKLSIVSDEPWIRTSLKFSTEQILSVGDTVYVTSYERPEVEDREFFPRLGSFNFYLNTTVANYRHAELVKHAMEEGWRVVD